MPSWSRKGSSLCSKLLDFTATDSLRGSAWISCLHIAISAVLSSVNKMSVGIFVLFETALYWYLDSDNLLYFSPWLKSLWVQWECLLMVRLQLWVPLPSLLDHLGRSSGAITAPIGRQVSLLAPALLAVKPERPVGPLLSRAASLSQVSMVMVHWDNPIGQIVWTRLAAKTWNLLGSFAM